jgi:hypothetical protein
MASGFTNLLELLGITLSKIVILNPDFGFDVSDRNQGVSVGNRNQGLTLSSRKQGFSVNNRIQGFDAEK